MLLYIYYNYYNKYNIIFIYDNITIFSDNYSTIINKNDINGLYNKLYYKINYNIMDDTREKLKEKIEDNKLKYLIKIDRLVKKGAKLRKKVDLNSSFDEIIKAYTFLYHEYEDSVQEQKLNSIINMGRIALKHIDPDWETKIEGENVGIIDDIIKEFIRKNTGNAIYEKDTF